MKEKTKEVKVGDIVTYSDKCKKDFKLRKPNRFGIVIGYCKRRDFFGLHKTDLIKVHWLGTKRYDVWHKSYMVRGEIDAC